MRIKSIFSILLMGLAAAYSPIQASPEETISSDVVITERDHPTHHAIADATASAIVQEIVLRAISLIGVRYRWGGETPDNGLDCSGFIQYIFQQAANVALPRTAQGMSQVGTVISRDELQPGDLVFFNTLRRQFSHVGLYLGENHFIHAPSTGKTITIANLQQKYWLSRYNGARRLPHATFSDMSVNIKAISAERNDLVQIKPLSYQRTDVRKASAVVKLSSRQKSSPHKQRKKVTRQSLPKKKPGQKRRL